MSVYALASAQWPSESISMVFIGGLFKTHQEHDYLFLVVDRFSKMYVLLLHKTISGQEVTKFFTHV
jgi:hypothetical protein